MIKITTTVARIHRIRWSLKFMSVSSPFELVGRVPNFERARPLNEAPADQKALTIRQLCQIRSFRGDLWWRLDLHIKLDRHGLGQNVQHRAMRVDGISELLQVRLARR